MWENSIGDMLTGLPIYRRYGVEFPEPPFWLNDKNVFYVKKKKTIVE